MDIKYTGSPVLCNSTQLEDQFVTVGQTANFSCINDGTPPQWNVVEAVNMTNKHTHCSRHAITGNMAGNCHIPRHGFRGSEYEVLKVYNVSQNDDGNTYVCSFHNCCSRNATLHVILGIFIVLWNS